MTITAVIAEYNPFHNGHAYQLAKARELTGADYLVVIMSGDFVQRGAPAILDQHDRAELALLGGADLILQLPCHFALGSAQHFARGAVSLLTALGCVDFLCFGSEYGDTAPFLELADVLLHEPEEYRELLSGLLRNGLSFPTARAQALSAYFSDSASFSSLSKEELDTFLKEPNNILGIEYVQALLLSQSRIRPVTIRREGSGYHEGALFTHALPSATAMRNLLFSNPHKDLELSALASCMPEAVFHAFQNAVASHGLLTADDFSLLLAARLLTETKGSLSSCLDLSPDLANRILRQRHACSSFSEFAMQLKTKEMTYTRISRALMHLLLNQKTLYPAGYNRVLGFRKSAGALLKEIRRRSSLPLIAKAADAPRLLTGDALAAFESDIQASLFYETVRSHKTGTQFVHEYTKAGSVIEPAFFQQHHHLLLWNCIVLHKQENIFCICTFSCKVKLHETHLTIQYKIDHNMMHDVFCCSLCDCFHRHLLFYPIKIIYIARCITHEYLQNQCTGFLYNDF